MLLRGGGLGGGVDVGDDPQGAVVVGLQPGAFGGAGVAEAAEEGLGPFGVLGPDGPVVLVVGGLRAARRVTHAGQWPVGGRGAGEFEAERPGGIGEPAVVRGAQVQGAGAFGQQVEDVAVVGWIFGAAGSVASRLSMWAKNSVSSRAPGPAGMMPCW